jgi:bloom syndrome protein
MVDCRRALQLDYFGEHFTREQCLLNKPSACDNCSRVAQYKDIDATEICKKCIEAIRDHCTSSRHTVLQMVELFKGAETKRIVDNGLNKTKYHGIMKQWDRSDIQRILHKLIIENYLREDIIIIRDIPQSYIKLGTKVSQLMAPTSKLKINFAISNVSCQRH